DRVPGRVALEDIRDPFTNTIIVQANDEIDDPKVAAIEEACLERVKIRSVLTCQSRQGGCMQCYGRDLARAHPVQPGEPIGDIVEGITMEEKVDERTGLSTKVVVDTKDVDKRPRVTIKDTTGQTAKVTGGSGEARYLLPVGAHLNVIEGQPVSAGDVIAKMPRGSTKTK